MYIDIEGCIVMAIPVPERLPLRFLPDLALNAG